MSALVRGVASNAIDHVRKFLDSSPGDNVRNRGNRFLIPSLSLFLLVISTVLFVMGNVGTSADETIPTSAPGDGDATWLALDWVFFLGSWLFFLSQLGKQVYGKFQKDNQRTRGRLANQDVQLMSIEAFFAFVGLVFSFVYLLSTQGNSFQTWSFIINFFLFLGSVIIAAINVKDAQDVLRGTISGRNAYLLERQPSRGKRL